MSKRSGPAPQRARLAGRDVLTRVVGVCPEAFLEFDANGLVTEWNPHAEELFGWRRDEVVGQRLDETILSGDRGTIATAHLASGSANGNGSTARPRILEFLAGNGQTVLVEALVFALTPTKERNGDRRTGAFLRRIEMRPTEPVTVGGRAEAPPTLPSREEFEGDVERALATDARPGAVAVVLLDLDRFRSVNQAWGRDAGDTVLDMVGGRLRRISNSDPIARIGGDGFLALFVDPSGHAVRAATAFVERARGALAEPFPVGASEVFVDVTAGIALNTFGVGDAATLVANA